MKEKQITILGAGNIGMAIARGLVKSGDISAENIRLNRRRIELLNGAGEEGFIIEPDKKKALKSTHIVILAVEPHQAENVLNEISDYVNNTQVVMSIVTGLSIEKIKSITGEEIQVVRVMPNTAIALNESMTCISAEEMDSKALKLAHKTFSILGKCITIREDQMNSATALVACGVAFFLRAIRAASQGGIEIGFHSQEAIKMAAQTAKGAAELLLSGNKHPEEEIDRVTTPKGVTISGLNQMEHEGFSSAMIRGITLAAEKASGM